MPIRTHRGRAAAWRRVWCWPLRSGRRLAATAATAGVVVATAGLTLSSAGADEPETGPAPTPPVAPSTPSTSPPVAPPSSASPDSSSSPTLPPPKPPADPKPALAAAHEFAVVFAHHPPEMTPEQWAGRLRPLVTPERGGMLATTDPSRIESTRVTGPPEPTKVGSAVVHATVPTDAGNLAIVVVREHDTWLVRSYDQAVP